MKVRRFLALDIGAESGRAIEGWIEDGFLRTREIHRFPNTPVQIDHTLRWDLDSLVLGVKKSITLASADLASVGIDTWAIDFVLLDGSDRVIEPPFHYRDSRTDGMMEEAFRKAGRSDIYRHTGIQFLQINTLYQLLSMAKSGSPALAQAKTFLTIPDYLNFALTGFKGCEFTNATTTQCLDAKTVDWAHALLNKLGIRGDIFPRIVQPGTIIGHMPDSGLKVVAPASHDTGSAVAAVPGQGDDFAWISSGTWSIMGVETPCPIISDASCEANFTNEGGVEGTYRFCKNVMGLWILQQCRARWESEGLAFSYEELARLAEQAEPEFARFDPDDPEMLKPGDMPARIRAQLTKGGQRIPETPGQMARVILESLAARYKLVLDQLSTLTGRALARIHVVGGGSQNRLLNQLTANHCGVPVLSGPVEATALGNLLMQMRAMGEIDSIAEARSLVARSFEIERFEPSRPSAAQ